MAFLFREDEHDHSLFARYRTILERDWQGYYLGGLLTLAGFLPFAAGAGYAILSRSLLVMLLSSIVGGLIAGPFLYAFYDLLFRSLRDARSNWWRDYRRALRGNWKCALLPGAVFCLFLGVVIFMAMLLFAWSDVFTGWGNVLLLLVSALIVTMLFTVYWPQLVLFTQRGRQRFQNCILFCVKFFWHTLGAAAIQTGYWLVIALFLPWSTLIVAAAGLWFPLFLANFALYRDLDGAFGIEKAIREQFPDQMPDPDE